MSEQDNSKRYELRNRYLFKGRLHLQTALHIGGGKLTLSYSDSPVVLTPEGYPFIPGSSFKGALRSAVEKIVSSLPGFSSCALMEVSDEELKALGGNRKRIREICSTARQSEIAQRRRQEPENTEKILREAVEDLCDTCHLFGSPFTAARITINDLHLVNDEWSGVIQVRDGVAIDRDSESAKKGFKYDFEVVPATTKFGLTMMIENATPKDLQIISTGLSDFMHGFGAIGGKRSRGLGACLIPDLTVSFLELSGEKEVAQLRLQNYLLKGEFPEIVTGEKFLEAHISAAFKQSQ